MSQYRFEGGVQLEEAVRIDSLKITGGTCLARRWHLALLCFVKINYIKVNWIIVAERTDYRHSVFT